MFQSIRNKSVYVIRSCIPEAEIHARKAITINEKLWNARLRHLKFQGIKQLALNDSVIGQEMEKSIKGKITKSILRPKISRATNVGGYNIQ